MKQIHSKKYLLGFSIIIGVGLSALACGWDYFDYESSSFAPEIFADQNLSPMFYTGDSYFYQTDDYGYVKRFNSAIANDWINYLNPPYKKQLLDSATIKSLLFDNKVFNLKWVANMASGENTKELALNLPLKDAKFKFFLNYLYVARCIDQNSSNEYYYWGSQADDKEPVNVQQMQQTAFKLYQKATTAFEKQKAQLLILKMYFYYFNDLYFPEDMVLDKQGQFEKVCREAAKNTVHDMNYYRMMGYVAGINYRQENYTTSNYLYTKLFLNCPELQKSAIFSYHPVENNEVEEKIIAQCQNTDEQCAAWALQGYYTDEKFAINKILAIDPNSKYLPLLLSRAINIAEQSIVNLRTDSTLAVNNEFQYHLVDQSDSLYRQVKEISGRTDIKNKFVWYSALGYLEMLHHKNTDAEKSFALAVHAAPNTPEAKNQVRVLQLMNRLNQIRKITPGCFDGIADDIQWLLTTKSDEQRKELGALYQRINKAESWTRNYLHLLYKEDHKQAMAELYKQYNSWSYYAYDNKDSSLDKKSSLDSLLQLLQKKAPDTMEATAIKIGRITEQDIYDFRNVQAIFNNQLADIQHVADFDFPANPFNGSIKDDHDAEHCKGKLYSYKKSIENMQAMQEHIGKGEDVYNNALLLGNAFYSITHFGNCRLLSKLTGYSCEPFGYRPYVRKMIIDCSNAKKYYQMAYNAADNDEQRAKCAYMMAKCERNAYYSDCYYNAGFDSYYYSEEEYDDFKAWKGFQLLDEKYSHTDYYQEVIQECGYFNTYVNNPNRVK